MRSEFRTTLAVSAALLFIGANAAHAGPKGKTPTRHAKAACNAALKAPDAVVDIGIIGKRMVTLKSEPAPSLSVKEMIAQMMNDDWSSRATRSEWVAQIRIVGIQKSVKDFPFRDGDVIDVMIDPDRFLPLNSTGELRLDGKNLTLTAERTSDDKPLYLLESLRPKSVTMDVLREAAPGMKLEILSGEGSFGLKMAEMSFSDPRLPAPLDKFMKGWLKKAEAAQMFSVRHEAYSFVGKPYLDKIKFYMTKDGGVAGFLVWVTQDGAMTKSLKSRYFKNAAEARKAKADLDADVVWRQGYYFSSDLEMLGTFTGDEGLAWFGH